MRADPYSIDWKDADAYAPLLRADRSVFAWEWLRRDERYRAAAIRTLGEEQKYPSLAIDHHLAARRWGLHAFEWPCRSGLTARPVWSADLHPYVLAVHANGAVASANAFRLDRVRDCASLVTGSVGHEHLLISDGLRTIRLDVIEGSVTGSPVKFQYQLGGFEAAEKSLLALRRLLALWRTGHFPSTLYPQEARARRWLLMLRAYDALAAGADQREIAAQLLSRTSLEPRWRSDVPSLRSQVQRLVRGARAMAVNYRALLR